MKLSTARRKFKNQWMVFKIRREKPVVERDVLGTAKTRKIYRKLYRSERF